MTGIEFGTVWQLLTSEEQLDFWKYASGHARELNHRSGTFRQLCAALRDAESGSSGGRPRRTIPGAARPLSSDDLRLGVARHKGRLLGQLNAQPFLIGAFCNWIRNTRRSALNAVLDSVKCPRDESGTLKGAVPAFAPEAAQRDICALASDHGTHTLALVCGALMLNRDLWNGLAATYEALPNLEVSSISSSVPSMQPLSIKAPESEEPSPSNVPNVQPITIEALNTIRAGLDLLGQRLAAATSDISANKVPDLRAAIECWTLVRQQHGEAERALGVSSPRIGDLEAALRRQSEAAIAVTELSRCRSILHVADSGFVGRAIIRSKCDELETLAMSHQAFEPASWRAVSALLRLVETGDKLDDEQATQFQTQVEVLFGKAVAIAALRGKLAFETSSLIAVDEGIAAATTSTSPPTQNEKGAPEATTQQSTSPRDQQTSVSPGTQLEAFASAVPKAEPLEVINEGIPVSPRRPQAASARTEPEEATVIAANEASIDGVVESPDAETDRVEGPENAEPPAAIAQVTATSDYESFASFCDSHWVDTSGSVGAAPWMEDGFVPALAKQAVETWDLGQPAIAYLFARGVCAAGGDDPLGIDDLASADRLLSDPSSRSAGVDARRLEQLRLCISGPAARDKPTIGLTLMLEAIRPTLPCSFTPSEVDTLIARASYNDPALSEVVRFLLQGWSAQLNPLSLFRARILDAPEESVEVLEATLHAAQDALRMQVAALWSAAGGKIQRTHCRSAWTKFVQSEVVSLRDDLAPSDLTASSRIKWTPDRVRERVIAFGRSYQRIMDSAQVKHQDRSVADGAAQQIVEAVGVVADALQRLDAQRQWSRIPNYGAPHEASQRLLSGSSSNTADRLSASLFAAVLHDAPQANALRLKAGYLVNHVDAIRYLDPSALSRAGIASDGLSVLDFENAVAVSAMLLSWRTEHLPTESEDAVLWLDLRNVAVDRERRDILASLSSTDVLQTHERTLLHRYALELGDVVFEATRELERLWGASNELMAPTEDRLKAVVDEAKALTTVASNSMTRSLLLLAWLKQCVGLATFHRNLAAKALLDVAAERPHDVAARVANYFEAGDYRAGVALFHGGTVPTTGGDRLGSRRTRWREDALKNWSEPRTKLANDLKGFTKEQIDLVELWTTGTIEPSRREAMPRLLYAVISGEAGRSSSENQKRFPVKLAELREHKDRKTTISCETVRNYFQRAKLNPSFLPQLADFSQIVITPSPHQASRGGSVLDDWCKAAGNEAAGSLVVFLAPGLPLARRDELCSGLRKRGVAAAIVDDVDLCRLCAATARQDGHDFIPFLEVLLEQLDLERASPFSSHDGQHVRLETYIGRRYDAERVALGWSFTRVFSGRKLGKSALLKYVANTFDGYALPSGNTLNVFFITIAGGESERWVVDCIIDEMANRFGLPEKLGLRDQPPAERFSEYMKRFLQEKPRHSVLLILDEADAFVEGQLARYNLDREGSLSFRMMKELPAQVDSNQLPRIRTIFSGYRVTNTRGGVWANAGDVLVLRPLAEEEAVQFLEGMLARIGIALGNHAPFVAMRCGFQPAVLIRFGESLVRRLKRSNRSADRETLTVSHEEVLATLGEQGVLDEIKTVVNNNFQGNRIGAVVFGATLLALKDLEPGLALTEGPVQVLAKLREIDPNGDWLERVDTSPLSEIERNLQDFIDRELLTVLDAPRFGVREYRLRFPHFLPVLTQQSEVALEVRQQIQAIRGGASQRRVSQCVLSESALDTIRYWYHQNNGSECKLIIVGGHWTDALLDLKCGLPDRLGCERTALSLAPRADEASGQIEAGMQVFGNVSVDLWKTFLDVDAARPLVLVGDLDLQRKARLYALDGGQVPVEVVTLGQLTESTLAWWLEDARALHFKAGNSIARIAEATGLVPFLVGAFNRLLLQSSGSEVSERELDSALAQFDSQMPDYAAQLGDATWSGSLLPREIELLKMAVQITEEVSEKFDLEKDFHEYWSILDEPSTNGAPFSDPGDWSALKLLTEAGLLPARADVDSPTKSAQSLGRVSFERSGALVRLIKALGPNSAA
ncbi:MAG: hypothetical protein H6930_05380 [Rhodoferax sp.]|nr:hypothetical protein [Rhodoferax sp.]